MSKVLITGASGFIGTKLTERLVARGDDVRCLVRASSNTAALKRLGVRFAIGDVRDPKAILQSLSGAEVVYHLAGLIVAFRAEEMMQVNATGFGNVIAACAEQATPPVLVAVSSLAAAGPSRSSTPRAESDPPEPVSNYGRAKRAGEIIAEKYADRVPITILRPPIVFGEGDLQMRNIFRSISRLGVHLALSVANKRYSLVHVNDLVDAIILCAERGNRLPAQHNGSGQGYYFVACDEQPTFAELGRLIANSLGRATVRVMRSSGPAFIWSAAALAEGFARLRRRPYIFNFDKAREACAGNWICSSSAIRRDVGFAPAASLIERLRQTSLWYQQHNLL